MPAVILLECANCGAPLAAPKASNSTRCTYCGLELLVSDGATARATPHTPGLTEELLGGFKQTVGEGRRYHADEMATRDWQCFEYGLWPIRARASSSYGGGWSADSLLGAPRVFPRSGDCRGAWAPGTRVSRTEWVEVDFPDGPAAKAIRVFETCMPGATFAVTLADAGAEQLVWEGTPTLAGPQATVLEIPLDPPRRVTRVRVYVSNELGESWSEIDTIGLVSTEPVPQAHRKRRQSYRAVGWIGALVFLVGATGAVVVARARPRPDQRAVAAPLAAPPSRAAAPTRLAAPTRRIADTTMMNWNASVAQMNAEPTLWATEVMEFSSQYSSTTNAAATILGAPDVFPSHRDDAHAWASAGTSDGEEWVTVSFAEPIDARSVIVVETLNPGALVRIDDVTAGEAVELWAGTTSRLSSARVLSLELAAPRKMSRIRVVLDTLRTPGWSAIDAVGLVPKHSVNKPPRARRDKHRNKPKRRPN